MKKTFLDLWYWWVIILLGMLLSLTCCNLPKYTESEPITITGKIIYKHYEPSHIVFEYHYDYSIMQGKYCLHLGPNEHYAEYLTKYTFLDDTLSSDEQSLYESKDSIVNVTYKQIFQDSVFYRNDIISIK